MFDIRRRPEKGLREYRSLRHFVRRQRLHKPRSDYNKQFVLALVQRTAPKKLSQDGDVTQHLIWCCLDRQTYLLDRHTGEESRLPFEADMCRCHPTQHLCAFALGRGNHYMRTYDDYFAELHDKGDKHRIYVVDLSNQSVIDEQTGIGAVVDMCWSFDGRKLYAVTEDGLAYIYDLHRK